MYEVIKSIIDHVWQTQTSADQQYIYYICGALIVVLTAVILDFIFRMFSSFWRR